MSLFPSSGTGGHVSHNAQPGTLQQYVMCLKTGEHCITHIRGKVPHLGPVGEFVERQGVGLHFLSVVRSYEAHRALEACQPLPVVRRTRVPAAVGHGESGIR